MPRRFDAFAAMAVALAFWCWAAGHPAVWGRPAVVYVSPQGSNWDRGVGPDCPVRSIHEAVRRVQTGGTIRLMDGQYQERIHLQRAGLPDRPLVIEALNPGKATLSWEYDGGIPLRSEWRDEGNGIYSADVAWPLYVIRDGERALLFVPHNRLKDFRNLVAPDSSRSAFLNHGGRVYIFLEGRRPEACQLATHREVPIPREWGAFKSANLWVEADHVEIRGLNFEFGIGAGINLWQSKDCIVSNCAFTGATHGVRSLQKPAEPVSIRVDRCLYHNFPQKEWALDWLSWKELYANISENGLLSARGPQIELTRSIAVHCADAVQISPSQDSVAGRSVVRSNWFGLTSDDGLELDGPARDLLIDSNLLYDCYVAFACSPVTAGPVTITNNISWMTRRQRWGAHLKFLPPASMRNISIRNVHVLENLLAGASVSYWNPSIPVLESQIRSNLLFSLANPAPPWPPTVSAAENEVDADAAILIERPVEAAAELRRASRFSANWSRGLVHQPGPDWFPVSTHPATRELAAFARELRGDDP